ncbi:hypothetical protein C8J57DRAFT_1256696 [Mycena rebaudengoi]|nr:hypothetical protein C8J57DRAFT_1256696 [Mycena rebaudengoi]
MPRTTKRTQTLRKNAQKATQARKSTIKELHDKDCDHGDPVSATGSMHPHNTSHSHPEHHYPTSAPTDIDSGDTWDFDLGNELPDLDCEDPRPEDPEPDLDDEVVVSPEVSDETELAVFSKLLSDAQDTARAAERARKNGLKRPKYYSKNSKKTHYRNRKKRSEMEANGFMNVFDFMKAVKKRRLGDRPETSAEPLVEDSSADECSADEAEAESDVELNPEPPSEFPKETPQGLKIQPQSQLWIAP